MHQPLHFFVDRIQQVSFARFSREFRPLAKQSEGHVHAGDRRAQFMGSAQDKLTAHALERALLGDVVQHHHRTENMPLGMTDRRQAVSQQARFAIDFDAQIFRRPLQRAAAQDQLQLRIQFRAAERGAQALAQSIVFPAQLALSNRVEVLELALAINHQ